MTYVALAPGRDVGGFVAVNKVDFKRYKPRLQVPTWHHVISLMPALLTHASQLLTLRGYAPRRGASMRDLGVISDGAVFVQDGKIVAIGTTDEVTRVPQIRDLLSGANPGTTPSVEEVDCTNKVLLPGFVDSHTHPVFAHPRLIDFEKRISGAHYEEIAAAGGGIRSSIRGVRESLPNELARHVLRALNQMSTQGTTTVEAKSGYGLNLVSELKSLKVIQQAAHEWPGTVIPTLLAAHVIPPEHRENPDEYVRIVCDEMIPAVGSKLASYVDVFCERGAFSSEQSRSVLRAAVANGLKTRIHVGQLTHTDLELFAEFHPTSVDHLDHLTEADIAWLATADTVATLLPAANYFLGLNEFPPARKLIDNGAAVALATDYNPGTSPTTSMPFVLSVACTHMKMSPAEAITAATTNGACALALQHKKGSLEPGKDADIAIFDVQDYREIPYWFGVNRCWKTFLMGKSA
jgi:imidazolonepropionase